MNGAQVRYNSDFSVTILRASGPSGFGENERRGIFARTRIFRES